MHSKGMPKWKTGKWGKPAPKLDDDAERMRNQGDYFTSSPPRRAVAQTTLE